MKLKRWILFFGQKSNAPVAEATSDFSSPAEALPAIAENAPAPMPEDASETITGVLNGDYAVDLYKHIPCRVGSRYLRVQVDGGITPCCVMGTTLGSVANSNFTDVWFSDAYSVFRERMESIHKERFHLNDPEWAFCQHCPHSDQNIEDYFEDTFLEDARAATVDIVRKRVFEKIGQEL